MLLLQHGLELHLADLSPFAESSQCVSQTFDFELGGCVSAAKQTFRSQVDLQIMMFVWAWALSTVWPRHNFTTATINHNISMIRELFMLYKLIKWWQNMLDYNNQINLSNCDISFIGDPQLNFEKKFWLCVSYFHLIIMNMVTFQAENLQSSPVLRWIKCTFYFNLWLKI